MTNSEKAREYAAEKFKVNPESKKWNTTTTYMSACEWKDRQFKEYLEKKEDEFLKCTREDFLGRHFDVCVTLINEIINELFNAD